MRNTWYSTALAVLTAASCIAAFAPTAFVSTQTTRTTSPDSTRLFISSWGSAGPPHRRVAQKKKNPKDDIQSYIPKLEPVQARVNLEGTILISGLVNSKERTDQTLFDLVNTEESAYFFDKIVAFVDDAKFARKRLLSRSARYTGLLDKLAFIQANTPGALPTVEQLEDVSCWIAYIEGGDLLEQVKQVGAIAKAAPSIENLAILLVGAMDLDPKACEEAVEALKGREGMDYTLVAVAELEDSPEGNTMYGFDDFTTEDGILPDDLEFSRGEAFRLLTELLQLDCGRSKALSFYEVFDEDDEETITEKLIKGLRQAGYPRPVEVDHMIRFGVAAYEQAIEDFEESNPYAGVVSNNWWEDPAFQAEIAARTPKSEEEEPKVDARTLEIEKVAKEWAKREYFRQSMAGMIDMTEAEFTESIWDRALFEGDLKYRQVMGEIYDEETELSDFKKRQEKKKLVMLKRAKEELKDMLDEENLGGDDIDATLASINVDDDKTDSD